MSKRSVIKGYIGRMGEQMTTYHKFAKNEEIKQTETGKFFSLCERRKIKIFKRTIKELNDVGKSMKKQKEQEVDNLLTCKCPKRTTPLKNDEAVNILSDLPQYDSNPQLTDLNAGKTIKIIPYLNELNMSSQPHEWVKLVHQISDAKTELDGFKSQKNKKIQQLIKYLEKCESTLNLLIKRKYKGQDVVVDIDSEASQEKFGNELKEYNVEDEDTNGFILFSEEPSVNDYYQPQNQNCCWVNIGLAAILNLDKGKEIVKSCFVSEKIDEDDKTIGIKLHDYKKPNIKYNITVPISKVRKYTKKIITCSENRTRKKVLWPACLAYGLMVVLEQSYGGKIDDYGGEASLVYPILAGDVKHSGERLEFSDNDDGEKKKIKFLQLKDKYEKNKNSSWTFGFRSRGYYHTVLLKGVKYDTKSDDIEDNMKLVYLDQEGWEHGERETSVKNAKINNRIHFNILKI